MYKNITELMMDMNPRIREKLESTTIYVREIKGVDLHYKASLVWNAKDLAELRELHDEMLRRPKYLDFKTWKLLYQLKKFKLTQRKVPRNSIWK